MLNIPAILDFYGYEYSRDEICMIFGRECSVKFYLDKSTKSRLEQLHYEFDTLNGVLNKFISMIEKGE